MSVAETHIDDIPGAALRRRSMQSLLIKGIAFNWGSLLIGAVVSLLLTPIMIRDLGAYYYGMWALVMSLVDQYGLLDMGMGAALTRFAGFFQGSQERKGLDEIFSASLAFTILIGFCICLITIPAALLLPGFFEVEGPNRPTFMWLVAMLGLTTAIAFPERMMASYLRGLQRFDLFNAASTSMIVLRGVLCVAALAAGYKVLTIAAITLAMGAVSMALHYGMIRRADPALSLQLGNVRWARLRELFQFGTYAFIANLGVRLITRIDSIVIGRVLGVALVTPFSIGSRLMDYFAGVCSGVQGPLMSTMSELEGGSRKKDLQELFLRSSRFTFLLSALLGSLLVFDGRALLKLWLGSSGVDLDLTYRVLVILTSCYVASYGQLPAWTVIYARARHQLLAWLVLGEGAANLGLSIYWAHQYGLVGVALGTAVPALINHLLIIPWYALRVLDLPASAYFRQSLLRPAAASALMVGFCWLTMNSSGSLANFGLSVLSKLVVFSFLAYFLGIAGDDRELVRDRIQKWFPRLAGPKELVK